MSRPHPAARTSCKDADLRASFRSTDTSTRCQSNPPAGFNTRAHRHELIPRSLTDASPEVTRWFIVTQRKYHSWHFWLERSPFMFKNCSNLFQRLFDYDSLHGSHASGVCRLLLVTRSEATSPNVSSCCWWWTMRETNNKTIWTLTWSEAKSFSFHVAMVIF